MVNNKTIPEITKQVIEPVNVSPVIPNKLTFTSSILKMLPMLLRKILPKSIRNIPQDTLCNVWIR